MNTVTNEQECDVESLKAENEALRAQLKETEAKGRVLMDISRDLRKRVSELESILYDASIQAGRLDKAHILRKQAEAVEDMWDKVNPDNPGRSLRDEAQRLRRQANELESQSVGGE